MSKEVMKQALEALRMPCEFWNKTQFIKITEAIKALEEALKQEQSEPNNSEYERGFIDGMQKQMQSSVDKAVRSMKNKLTQEWEVLQSIKRHTITTQDEIQTAILRVCKVANHDSDFNVVGFHSLCDKLIKLGEEKERINAKQEQDEPYGYFRYDIRLDAWVQSRDNNKGVAFYTKTLTKEWVSLTNEQIEEIWGNTPMMLNSHNNRTRIVFAKAIEDKLKEKNHVVSGQ